MLCARVHRWTLPHLISGKRRLRSTTSKSCFCYKERVVRLAWFGALFAIAVLIAAPSIVAAQGDPAVEVITEPPPAPEPPPAEPAPEPETPPPDAPPKVEPPKEQIGQLRVGAGIGFGFGSDLITVGISPQVSYWMKKIVEPGVALRYQYTNDRFVVPNAIWHTFGGSLFVRLYPIPSLFFLVEGEIINTGYKQGDFSSGRQNYGNLFLGGGYVMGVGKGVFIAVSLKVNVFRNPFYPSNIPIFGVGAGYAF